MKNMTGGERLALALLLFRSYFNEFHNNHVPTNVSMDAMEWALGEAKRLGVSKEFVAVMKKFPVMRVEVKAELMTVEELEEWE